MTFNPSANLVGKTNYQVSIATTAKDLAGNALVASFSSVFASDSLPPTVTSVDPADQASGIATNRNVVVTFSEPMSRSATQSAFALRRAGTTTKLRGSFSWNQSGTVLTFNPSGSLFSGSTYQVTVASTAKDLAGIAVAGPFSSSFSAG
jgi:methionine-rich copper-binding protein CopC